MKHTFISAAAQDPKAAGRAYLAENCSKDGVVTLASGLQYKVLKSGDGESPKINTPCSCKYRGTFINGQQFDAGTATFAPNQVIKGWTEAMQLMKQGDCWELSIPFELAYGERGRPPKIPPCSALLFTMEILLVDPDRAKKVAGQQFLEANAVCFFRGERATSYEEQGASVVTNSSRL